MEDLPLKNTVENSSNLEYKYINISTLSCSQSKQEALERQQHNVKIELRSIWKKNQNPNTRERLVVQAEVTDLVRRGVARGLIVRDFTAKSSNMAEQKDGNKTTANVEHSSQASTGLSSEEVENESADSSFDCGVWVFTCLNPSSPITKKHALSRDQDQLIKGKEALIKANTITAMRTDPILFQKVPIILEGGERRRLLVKGKTRVIGDVHEATMKAEADIDGVDLILDHIDFGELDCSDEMRKGFDLQQKEIYEKKAQAFEEKMAQPDHKALIEVDSEYDKKPQDIMIEGRSRDLFKDRNLAPGDQRIPINEIFKGRVKQRTQRDPTLINSASHHHRELSQLLKTLGASSSIRDRPAPALVWRQRGYQAAELEFTDQKNPEDNECSWRPKDPLKLGPKDSTTFKEKRMIHEGKEMLKGTLSGYGGSVFPKVKDVGGVVQEVI